MLKKVGIVLALLVGLLLCIITYARFIEPNLLTVKSFTIVTEQPIKDCNVVFFTDTHFGRYYSEDHAKKIVDTINERNADIVIFGGDLLDNYARDREDMDLNYLKAEFSRIQSKAGKYAVWGNHDYGGGASRIYEDFMVSCGFEVLENERWILEDYGIELIGYDDYFMGWTEPSFYFIQSNLFPVIIVHEPVIAQLIKSKNESFVFSGHTHGGQVYIPFFMPKLLHQGSGTFVKGFYTAREIGTGSSLQMYTSSGIGMTRYPFRFLNLPEIVEIKFRSKNTN